MWHGMVPSQSLATIRRYFSSLIPFCGIGGCYRFPGKKRERTVCVFLDGLSKLKMKTLIRTPLEIYTPPPRLSTVTHPLIPQTAPPPLYLATKVLHVSTRVSNTHKTHTLDPPSPTFRSSVCVVFTKQKCAVNRTAYVCFQIQKHTIAHTHTHTQTTL